MKNKNTISILILFVVIVILSGITYFYFFPRNEQAAFSNLLTVIRENNSVSYSLDQGVTYSEINENEIQLESGVYLKTGETGTAQVFLPDNSIISIDVNTELEVVYADNSVNINQLIGNTWHRVQTVTQGGTYEVTTPNTIAAVRGTIFGIEVDAERKSKVYVEESNVDVSLFEDRDGTREILESLSMRAGDYMVTEKNDVSPAPTEGNIAQQQPEFVLRSSQVPTEITESSWYLKNKIIDERIENAQLEEKIDSFEGIDEFDEREILRNEFIDEFELILDGEDFDNRDLEYLQQRSEELLDDDVINFDQFEEIQDRANERTDMERQINQLIQDNDLANADLSIDEEEEIRNYLNDLVEQYERRAGFGPEVKCSLSVNQMYADRDRIVQGNESGIISRDDIIPIIDDIIEYCEMDMQSEDINPNEDTENILGDDTISPNDELQDTDLPPPNSDETNAPLNDDPTKVTNSSPQEEFQDSIAVVFDYFYNFDPNDPDICSDRFQNQDPEDLLFKFTDVELAYGVEPIAADENRSYVYFLVDICQDGIIDDLDAEELQFFKQI